MSETPNKIPSLLAALAIGAGVGVGVRQVAGPSDDLGGWHYGEIPAMACTTVIGPSMGRISIRPDVLTNNGTLVTRPELRVDGADLWICAVSPDVDRSKTPAANDTCYQRQPDGTVEITAGGRLIKRKSTFPTCILDAYQQALIAHPLVSGVPAP